MPYWELLLMGPSTSTVDAAFFCQMSSLKITGSISGYHLRSTEFEALEEPAEVYALAQQRIAQLNGVVSLLLSAFDPIKLAPSVSRINDDGTKKVWVFPLPREKIPEFRKEPSPAAKSISPALVNEWIASARHSASLTDALRIFASHRHEWAALYKVLELVRGNVSPSIEEQAWATSGELRRFTQTANSAEAVGDHARHSRGRVNPPRASMTQNQALELIGRILRKWIESRAAETRRAHASGR